MKYGVNTFIWTASFGPSELSLLGPIREHGFDGVEVPLFRPSEFPAALIRQARRDYGLDFTVCSIIPGGMSILSEDNSVRSQTIAHLKDCARAVADSGAGLIAGPLYSPVGYLPGRRRTAEEWQRAVEAYQEIGPVFAENGVTLAIEPLNRFETYFLNTAADGAALCRQVGHPNIGLLIDTFHSNIEEKKVGDAYRTAGAFLRHVHTCENDRGTPGTGHVDWPDVFAALSEVGYDGWLTIESFGFALGELSAAASIWRDIAPTPESIAFEGVGFLKRGVAARAGV